MADQNNVASDMSGRPIRRATAAEAIASLKDHPPPRPSYDIISSRDGDDTRYAYTGGKYYPLNEDWEPDWDRPLSEADFLSGKPAS